MSVARVVKVITTPQVITLITLSLSGCDGWMRPASVPARSWPASRARNGIALDAERK